MIRFPTTPELFIADQERLMSRKLAEHEREATAAWVKVFNLVYEDGLKQDHDTLMKDLDKLDELMARHKDRARVHKFAEDCRAWIVEAWKQGAERSISK